MATINDNGNGNTLTGTDLDDIINGNGGNDTLIGLRGKDQLFGGSGSDTFDYRESAFSESVPGEIIDGGTDFGTVDRILVDGKVSFLGADIRSIEEIEFKFGSSFTSHRAEFTASQFGAGKIASNVVLDASGDDANEVRVLMGTSSSFDASQFRFESWSTDTDLLRILGDSSSEVITLSVMKDNVTAESGNDIIRNIRNSDQVSAGEGTDTMFVSGSLFDATLSGGNGADLLVVNGNTELRAATISSIEAMQFDPATTNTALIQVTAAQIGNGALTSNLLVTGRANAEDVIVVSTGSNQAAADLSQFTFSNFGAGNDRINIVGSNASDNLTGSSVNDVIDGGLLDDVISGGRGRDDLTGFSGNDVIIIDQLSNDFGTNDGAEIYDGGGGFDTLRLINTDADPFSNNYQLTRSGGEAQLSIQSIERIEIDLSAGSFASLEYNVEDFPANVVIDTTGVDLSLGLNTRDDTAFTSVDLSLIQLIGFEAGNQIAVDVGDAGSLVIGRDDARLNVFASSGNDTLIGGDFNSFSSVPGFRGDLLKTGLGGLDTLRGGGGQDTLIMQAQVQAGSVFDGGTGEDVLQFQVSADFRDYSVQSIESLEFFAGLGAAVATVGADQIGTGFSSDLFVSVLGTPAAGTKLTLDVQMGNETNVDLSAFAFDTNWRLGVNLPGDVVQVTGNDFANTIKGSVSSDVIRGFGENDIIDGLSGADTLVGGSGRDFLTGGEDRDTFVFLSAAQSAAGAGRDIITDFTHDEDVINVRRIDANEGRDGNQNFVQDTNGVLVAGEFRIRASGDNKVVDFFTDAEAGADMQILVSGAATTLALSDFIL